MCIRDRHSSDYCRDYFWLRIRSAATQIYYCNCGSGCSNVRTWYPPCKLFVLCCNNLYFLSCCKLVYAQEADKDRHGRISEIRRVKGVTDQGSLSCEVIWHIYAKIPGYTGQDTIPNGELECIFARLLWRSWTADQLLKYLWNFCVPAWQPQKMQL